MNGEPLTRRTDIWSWAVCVLEMLTGERLWQNGVVAGVECSEYLEFARLPAPPDLEDLLRRCFMEDQAERPHDFAQVETFLLNLYEHVTKNSYPRPTSGALKQTVEELNNRALSYLDIGNFAQAEACWEKALEID